MLLNVKNDTLIAKFIKLKKKTFLHIPLANVLGFRDGLSMQISIVSSNGMLVKLLDVGCLGSFLPCILSLSQIVLSVEFRNSDGTCTKSMDDLKLWG